MLLRDNCGEVTIEVSSETTAGDCDGIYFDAHVHRDGRRWQQQFRHPNDHYEDTMLLN